MPRYDFATLSGQDFEELGRDLLQADWGVALEAFKAGRDRGIDLRYALRDGGRRLSNPSTTPSQASLNSSAIYVTMNYRRS